MNDRTKEERQKKLQQLRDEFVTLGNPHSLRESKLYRILTGFLEVTNESQMDLIKEHEKLQWQYNAMKRSVYLPSPN